MQSLAHAITAAALVGAVLLTAPRPAAAGPRDFAIFVTRLGGDPESAEPYIAKFMAYMEETARWPRGSAKGAFLPTRKEALAFIESQKPGWGLVEPSLYLELRKSHDLEPIAQVVSKDLVSGHLHVVVRDPTLRTLSELKGKRLWTTLGDAPNYLSRIVLDGHVDAASHFQLKTVGQAMKGVRALLRGEADATIIDSEQFEAARKLEGGAQLHAVYDSQPLPPMPVVTFGKALKPEERQQLARVLIEMCGTSKGGPVCQEMHITKFVPVSGNAFVSAHRRYEKP